MTIRGDKSWFNVKINPSMLFKNHIVSELQFFGSIPEKAFCNKRVPMENLPAEVVQLSVPLEVILPWRGIKAGGEVALEPGGLLGVDLEVACNIRFSHFFSTEQARLLLLVRFQREQRLELGRGGGRCAAE